MANKYLKMAKDSTKLGVMSMAGGVAVGKVGAMAPGSAPAQKATMTGLQLANLGQTAKIGLNLMPDKKKKLKW